MKTQPKTNPAPTAPKATQITFVPHAEKPETKNCYRFDEQTPNGMPPKIGTLYVQKWALGNQMPKSITLTLESN